MAKKRRYHISEKNFEVSDVEWQQKQLARVESGEISLETARTYDADRKKWLRTRKGKEEHREIQREYVQKKYSTKDENQVVIGDKRNRYLHVFRAKLKKEYQTPDSKYAYFVTSSPHPYITASEQNDTYEDIVYNSGYENIDWDDIYFLCSYDQLEPEKHKKRISPEVL